MFDYIAAQFNVIKEIDTAPISRELLPGLYYEGSPFINRESRGFQTPADPTQINLRSSYEIIGGISLSLILYECE